MAWAKSEDNSVTNSNVPTPNEWEARNRRISRQGCIQVAVQVSGTFEQAVTLADKMLAYVNAD